MPPMKTPCQVPRPSAMKSPKTNEKLLPKDLPANTDINRSSEPGSNKLLLLRISSLQGALEESNQARIISEARCLALENSLKDPAQCHASPRLASRMTGVGRADPPALPRGGVL